MAADLDRLLRLREQMEAMQREADKAEGALQNILERLKDEFSCDSLATAAEVLKDLKAELKETEDLFEMEIRKFERKWEKILR